MRWTAEKASSDETMSETRHITRRSRIAPSETAVNGHINVRYFFCTGGDNEQEMMDLPKTSLVHCDYERAS